MSTDRDDLIAHALYKLIEDAGGEIVLTEDEIKRADRVRIVVTEEDGLVKLTNLPDWVQLDEPDADEAFDVPDAPGWGDPLLPTPQPWQPMPTLPQPWTPNPTVTNPMWTTTTTADTTTPTGTALQWGWPADKR